MPHDGVAAEFRTWSPSPAQPVLMNWYTKDGKITPSYEVDFDVAISQLACILGFMACVLAVRLYSKSAVSGFAAVCAGVVVSSLCYFLFAYGLHRPGAAIPASGSILDELTLDSLLKMRGSVTLALLAWTLVHLASPFTFHGAALPFCCASSLDEDSQLAPVAAGMRGGAEEAEEASCSATFLRLLATVLAAVNVAATTVILVYGQELGQGIRVMFTVWQGGVWLLLAVGCLLPFDTVRGRAALQTLILWGSALTSAWITTWAEVNFPELSEKFPDKHFLGWPAHAANATLIFGFAYACMVGCVQFTLCGGLSAPPRLPSDASVALLGGQATASLPASGREYTPSANRHDAGSSYQAVPGYTF